MHWIRGYYRLGLAGLILGFGGPFIVFASIFPIEVNGLPLALWVLKGVVALLLLLLNVKVSCPDPEKLRGHRGFVFPNHISYLDILVLLHIAPMRFLAREGVRRWPIVGMVGKAIGCVFVNREDKQSRSEARTALSKVERFPPIALFPEGKRGPGHELLPFRYGAFEIVTQGEVPFLPCAIAYRPLETGIWRRSEHFLKALWRVVGQSGPLQVQVIPLEAVQPTADMDPVNLSVEVRGRISAGLQREGSFLHPPD